MSMLNDLEKITDFSEGGQDPRSTLSICQGCFLKTSPYVLCFYRKRLNKGVQCSSSDDKDSACSNINQVTVMFVSRDPNITCCEINYHGNPTKVVTSWNSPRRHGLGFFFNDFLQYKNSWSKFLDYLKNTNSAPIPRFYWTHLIKCHAFNNVNNVNNAIGFCLKYLVDEIHHLKPIVIVAAGLDVAREVFNCVGTRIWHKISFRNVSTENQTTIRNGKGIVVIPHPSQAPYQMWKQGRFDIGITVSDFRNLINPLL